MRRLIVGLMMLGGCVKENPAWEGDATSRGATGPGAGSEDTGAATSAGSTRTSAPTEGSASDAGDDVTTVSVAASSGTDGSSGGPTSRADTSGDPSSSGDSSSSGGAVAQCLAFEIVPLPVPPVEDTGVVPTAMGMCPWGGEDPCGALNFGKTEFYRLVKDAEKGVNAALLRFPVVTLADAVAVVGRDPGDLLGLRISVVLWEAKKLPDAPYTLQIHALAPANTGWTEGGRDAEVAQEGDSSDDCRTVTKQGCEPWAGGSALAGSTPLGELLVDKDKVVAADMDRIDGEYHASIVSERLVGALELFDGVGMPGFGVTLATQRNLDEDVVGIKFKEVEAWADPTLYGDFCTQWSE